MSDHEVACRELEEHLGCHRGSSHGAIEGGQRAHSPSSPLRRELKLNFMAHLRKDPALRYNCGQESSSHRRHERDGSYTNHQTLELWERYDEFLADEPRQSKIVNYKAWGRELLTVLFTGYSGYSQVPCADAFALSLGSPPLLEPPPSRYQANFLYAEL